MLAHINNNNILNIFLLNEIRALAWSQKKYFKHFLFYKNKNVYHRQSIIHYLKIIFRDFFFYCRWVDQ